MTAISGMASSARHCVSGDAANVHPIGWVEAGSRYTITTEGDFTPMTGIARLNLDEESATVNYGTPDIRATASTSGTMALHVGGVRQGGCYRYKVEIEPPARSTPAGASFAPAAPARLLAKPPKGRIRTMAISGLASSAKHCVAGSWVSNVHGIGRVEQGSEVRLTFESDFDPVAGITLMNLEGQRGTYLVDDDSGGNLEPLLNFTAS